MTMFCRCTARASTKALSAVRAQLVAHTPSFAARPTTAQVTILTSFSFRTVSLNAARQYSSDSAIDGSKTKYPSNISRTSSDADKLKSGFWPPWQVTDLAQFEQGAYKEHGADFMQHLAGKDAYQMRAQAKRRLRAEKQFEAKWGEDWHDILIESDKRLAPILAQEKEARIKAQEEAQASQDPEEKAAALTQWKTVERPRLKALGFERRQRMMQTLSDERRQGST